VAAEPSPIVPSARARPSRLVEPQIRSREQMRRGRQNELGEVGRPLAEKSRVRLRDLERVPDGVPEPADPCL